MSQFTRNEGSRFSGTARFGIFEVHAGELRRQGVKIKLQDQPFQLLLALLERPGDVVTREQLKKQLWPSDTFVDFEPGLNRAVNKLRDALGDSSESPRWVETVPRRGYRFIAPVNFEEAPASSPAEESPAATVTTEVATANTGLTRRRAYWFAATLLIAAIGSVLTASFYSRFAAGQPLRSIAVLPLEDLSDDPSHHYFADGMTDGLITEIARIRSLRVISRTSIMQYKGSRKPLSTIASELGVDAVIEGTILHSGNKVRITAQLIRASDDQHLWSDKYERSLDDALKLQSEVAESIAAQVRARMEPRERAAMQRVRTVNQRAYEAYVEGSYYGSKTSEQSLNKSVDLLKRCVEIDPNYPQGYAGLSHSYYVLGMLGMRPPSEAYTAAKAAALRALQLDGTIAEAHNTLAEVERGYQFNWQAAEAEFQRALELNPSYALAHSGYASVLSNMGRHREAIAEATRARERDPVSVSANTALARILYRARRYDDSITSARKAVELDSGDASPLWWIALSEQQKAQHELAIKDLEKAVDLSGNSTLSLSLLANAYTSAGRRADAISILGRLTTLSPGRYVSPIDLAIIYTGLGDRDAAFLWLTKAYEQRTMRIQQLPEPIFDSLGGDPRFHALAQKLKLAI